MTLVLPSMTLPSGILQHATSAFPMLSSPARAEDKSPIAKMQRVLEIEKWLPSKSSSQPKYKKSSQSVRAKLSTAQSQSVYISKARNQHHSEKKLYTFFGVSIRVTLLLRAEFSSLSVEAILADRPRV
jgi:hypothetical protein